MLPADMLGTYVENLPIFADYNDTDPSRAQHHRQLQHQHLRHRAHRAGLLPLSAPIHASLSTSPSLAFSLCCSATTHLHYTQNMMENNYIFLLTLAGFCFEYEWLRTGSRRALLIGTGALGLNLLTRLTTGLDLLAGVLFVLLVLWFEGLRGRALWNRCRAYAIIAIPVFCFFGLLDRLYQFYRFGSFTNTYVSRGRERSNRSANPTCRPTYPWTTPFHDGFLGALFWPEKSIFLFDPLLILAIVLIALNWKRLLPSVRAFALATSLLLLGYLSFYARYFAWAGDFSWGDRYVSTTVELVALIAIPLLLRHRRELGKLVFAAGIVLLASVPRFN